MSTPDTTTTQAIALLRAIIAVLIAFGLHLTSTQQIAILGLAATLSSSLVIADAIIRHGRSRTLTPAPLAIDLNRARRTDQPLTPPAPMTPASSSPQTVTLQPPQTFVQQQPSPTA